MGGRVWETCVVPLVQCQGSHRVVVGVVVEKWLEHRQ